MTRDEIIERLIIEWRSELLIGEHVAVRRYRPELAALLDALIDADRAADTAAATDTEKVTVNRVYLDDLERAVMDYADAENAADNACTCPCRGECTT